MELIKKYTAFLYVLLMCLTMAMPVMHAMNQQDDGAAAVLGGGQQGQPLNNQQQDQAPLPQDEEQEQEEEEHKQLGYQDNSDIEYVPGGWIVRNGWGLGKQTVGYGWQKLNAGRSKIRPSWPLIGRLSTQNNQPVNNAPALEQQLPLVPVPPQQQQGGGQQIGKFKSLVLWTGENLSSARELTYRGLERYVAPRIPTAATTEKTGYTLTSLWALAEFAGYIQMGPGALLASPSTWGALGGMCLVSASAKRARAKKAQQRGFFDNVAIIASSVDKLAAGMAGTLEQMEQLEPTPADEEIKEGQDSNAQKLVDIGFGVQSQVLDRAAGLARKLNQKKQGPWGRLIDTANHVAEGVDCVVGGVVASQAGEDRPDNMVAAFGHDLGIMAQASSTVVKKGGELAQEHLTPGGEQGPMGQLVGTAKSVIVGANNVSAGVKAAQEGQVRPDSGLKATGHDLAIMAQAAGLAARKGAGAVSAYVQDDQQQQNAGEQPQNREGVLPLVLGADAAANVRTGLVGAVAEFKKTAKGITTAVNALNTGKSDDPEKPALGLGHLVSNMAGTSKQLEAITESLTPGERTKLLDEMEARISKNVSKVVNKGSSNIAPVLSLIGLCSGFIGLYFAQKTLKEAGGTKGILDGVKRFLRDLAADVMMKEREDKDGQNADATLDGFAADAPKEGALDIADDAKMVAGDAAHQQSNCAVVADVPVDKHAAYLGTTNGLLYGKSTPGKNAKMSKIFDKIKNTLRRRKRVTKPGMAVAA